MKNNKLAPLSHDELRGLSGGGFWQFVITICLAIDATLSATDAAVEEAGNVLSEKGW